MQGTYLKNIKRIPHNSETCILMSQLARQALKTTYVPINKYMQKEDAKTIPANYLIHTLCNTIQL